jgi:hypothetical protein
VAFAAIKGGYYQTPFHPEARLVPGIFVTGETDLDYRRANPRKLVTDHRLSGALWCLAEEPNAGHAVGDSNRLVLSFFDGVLDRRVGIAASLAQLDESSGWLGDLHTGFVAKRSARSVPNAETVWLPDENSARRWEAWHARPDSYPR